MAQQVKSLDTGIMESTIDTFRKEIQRFQVCRRNIDTITDYLLDDWNGKSKNEYEKQYNILNRNLKDIEDSLFDFYDALIESGAAYIETDVAIGKELKMEK